MANQLTIMGALEKMKRAFPINSRGFPPLEHKDMTIALIYWYRDCESGINGCYRILLTVAPYSFLHPRGYRACAIFRQLEISPRDNKDDPQRYLVLYPLSNRVRPTSTQATRLHHAILGKSTKSLSSGLCILRKCRRSVYIPARSATSPAT